MASKKVEICLEKKNSSTNIPLLSLRKSEQKAASDWLKQCGTYLTTS